ncbi:hypothetical protein SEA_OZZYJ_30 [Streptomyces phage OzzyJ]|uniref:Uncharacterized protein n=1 Tax=Streptomyces phage Werner TaxID=2801898 RepID=A0A7U0GCV2_9CAUD|nr:hypothetical protein KGG99_gp29 [Streptomyces phage Werner]AVE00411.1 hypothetical protein SEA_OZZYJ_30 [Streptomyces phage OzzyJ]QAY17711.1 hypothetical protein SEA_ASTEN_29 [Streptomyces phage Asten]QFP95196.1 hypothetical protein SEA_WHATEVER_29 [Streptomyces phage Whatever]QQO39644.1 hypothetical protein SEA_HIPPO_29 [Streptomyces phage Hippo]QYW07213.1 hypothetical protein SEA_CHUCKY_29 [Streptomyces phage Chucky]QYW07948.1 hypothetical protein SEA_TRISTE_29 [Streptomyces phage Triste
MPQDDRPPRPVGRRPVEYAVDGGSIVIHLDYEGFDFHITATEDHCPELMAEVLDHQRRRGLVPMAECFPKILDDGRVRGYLTPVCPVTAPGEPLEVVA